MSYRAFLHDYLILGRMKGGKMKRVIWSWALVVLLVATFPFASFLQAGADSPQGWFRQHVGAADDCSSVYAVDAQTAWAVGYNFAGSYDGFVARTIDGGNSWAVTRHPRYYFFDVFAVDESTSWAVGYNYSLGGIILKTTDGGASWENQVSGISMHIGGISGLSANTAWAVGYTGTSHQGTILKTSDGGGTWVEQNPGVAVNLYDVEAVDADTAWAVGEDSGYRGVILKTTDGGCTWTVQMTGVTDVLRGVSALDSETAIAVGMDGTILKTTDGGAVWNPLDARTNSHFFGVDMVDPDIAWVVGRNFEGGSMVGVIYKTLDGGNTWKTQGPTAQTYSLDKVSAVDPYVAWAVGYYGVIWHTVDGGGQATPQVWSYFPDNGYPGDEVVINGSDFGWEQGASYVKFGSYNATEYDLWTDGEIRCRVPAMPPGNVTIQVWTSYGRSLGVDFVVRVINPVINTIFPNFGVENTYVMVTITGANFWPGASVWLEKPGPWFVVGKNITVSEDHTVITCGFDLTRAPLGKYDVVVSNVDGGVGRKEKGFTVTNVCGYSGGAAMLAFALTVGLFSIASKSLARKRRKRQRAGSR